jgi:hypothetical protein
MGCLLAAWHHIFYVDYEKIFIFSGACKHLYLFSFETKISYFYLSGLKSCSCHGGIILGVEAPESAQVEVLSRVSLECVPLVLRRGPNG